MEIKTCEQYVLAKLQELEDDNYELKMVIAELIDLLEDQGINIPNDFDKVRN